MVHPHGDLHCASRVRKPSCTTVAALRASPTAGTVSDRRRRAGASVFDTVEHMGNADVGMIDPSLIRSAQASRSVLPGSRIRGPTPPPGLRIPIVGINGAGCQSTSGTNMNIRDKLRHVLPLLTLVTMSAQSATITVKEVKQPGFYAYGWEITSVQTSPAEFKKTYYPYPLYSPQFFMYLPPHTTGTCLAYGPTPPECLYGRMPPSVGCATPEQAMQQLQQLVGSGIAAYVKEPPSMLYFQCPATLGSQEVWMVDAHAIATPAPTSCATADVQLTIRGRVGERATATTELRILCDSPATVRLTLSDGGLVNVAGEGQVRLLFGKNGRDVLDVSGTAPLVEIEGELIKSPTTAGTYRGSSVLRLDLL